MKYNKSTLIKISNVIASIYIRDKNGNKFASLDTRTSFRAKHNRVMAESQKNDKTSVMSLGARFPALTLQENRRTRENVRKERIFYLSVYICMYNTRH